MLEPETQPSPARELLHQGKGCAAVLLALAVLVFGGYFLYDKANGLLNSFGETPDYVGAGKAPITITVPEGATLDEIGGILLKSKVIKSTSAWTRAGRSAGTAHRGPPGR